jgi:serine protease inhibitor
VQYPFAPHTRVILANAIHFKGEWEHSFDQRQTRPHDFHLSSGQMKSTPMMVQNREFTYQETASFQAVQLPYKGGLRMEVLLPAANSNPQQLLESLKTPGNWQGNLQPAFADREGTLILPKFKMEYAVELNSPLKALGMNRAFGEEAEFSAMATNHYASAK